MGYYKDVKEIADFDAMLEEDKKAKCPVVLLSDKEENDWQKNGWLSDSGVCDFPEEVKAFPMEAHWVGMPPEAWEQATETEIRNAIDNGEILFRDGNGDLYRKDKYMMKYPAPFPDPEKVLRLRHKLPPNLDLFVKVGKH
jgi:hypothetical protein